MGKPIFDVVQVERYDDKKDAGIAINIAVVVRIGTDNGLMSEIKQMFEKIIVQIDGLFENAEKQTKYNEETISSIVYRLHELEKAVEGLKKPEKGASEVRKFYRKPVHLPLNFPKP